MNAAEQAERRLQRWAALAAFVVAIAAAIFASAAFPFVARSEAYLFVAANLLFLLALAFIPAWLHARPGFLVRSIVWQAVFRWCALLLAAGYWLLFVRPAGASAVAICLAALAAVNVIAAGLGGRHWHHHDLAWTLYFAGDFVLLVYLVGALDWPLLFALIAGASAFLLILSAGHGPRAAVGFVGGLYVGLLYGGTGWMRAHAILWFTVLVIAAYGISRLAARPAPLPPGPAGTPSTPTLEATQPDSDSTAVDHPAPPPS